MLVLLASCANSLDYTLPPTREGVKKSLTVNAPFDRVWDELIAKVGSTFFAIENFEKASGLLTLSFTTSPFSKSVDGGHSKRHFDNSFSAPIGHATVINFDGNYADYLQQFLNATLLGKVNLVVRSIDANSTSVTVNTRFVVSAPNGPTLLTWSWNSGERCSQSVKDGASGQMVERVFQSTGFVEKQIMDAIQSL